MLTLHVCWRCGDWPDAWYALEGHDWCGPCAPWARAPWPFARLTDLGARVLERLDREGLAQARPDAERVVAWLERAAAEWPGPRAWRTVRLAERAEAKLLLLEVWRPLPPMKSMWWGGHKWPDPPAVAARRPRDALPLHGDAPRE